MKLGSSDQDHTPAIAELTERKAIVPSLMTRILRLTLLAPDTVEVIFDGKQGQEVLLAWVLEPFPLECELPFLQGNFP